MTGPHKDVIQELEWQICAGNVDAPYALGLLYLSNLDVLDLPIEERLTTIETLLRRSAAAGSVSAARFLNDRWSRMKSAAERILSLGDSAI